MPTPPEEGTTLLDDPGAAAPYDSASAPAGPDDATTLLASGSPDDATTLLGAVAPYDIQGGGAPWHA